MNRLTVQGVREEYARRSTEKKGPMELLRSTARVLHDVPREGLFTPEFYPIFFDLVSFYRQQKYFEDGLDHSLIDAEILLLAEKSVRYFLGDVCKAIAAKTLVLPPLGAKQFELNIKYANFLAGVFALARGQSDDAALFFIDAADTWGVKSTEVSALCEKNPAQAAARLGGRFEQIKIKLSSPAAAQAAARLPKAPPSRPAPPPPAGDQDFARLLADGERLAGERRYLDSLRALHRAIMLKDDQRAKEAFGHVLQFCYVWVREVKDNSAETLRRAELLIGVKEDEATAQLIAARALESMKRYQEGVARAKRVRELPAKPEEIQEAEYLEAVADYRLGKDAEALAIMDSFPEKHPFLVRSLRIELYIFDNDQSRDKKRYQQTLEKLTDLKGLADYEEMYFLARLMAMEETIEALERAHNLALKAVGAARDAKRFEFGKKCSELANKLLAKLVEKRGEEAKKTPPAPPPPPPPPPVVDFKAQEAALAAREQAIAGREAELTELRNRIEAEQGALAERERKLGEQIAGLERLMEQRHDELVALERSLSDRTAALKQQEEALAAREAAVGRRESQQSRQAVEVKTVQSRSSIPTGLIQALKIIPSGDFIKAKGALEALNYDGLIDQVRKVVLWMLDKLIGGTDAKQQQEKLSQEIARLSEQLEQRRQEVASLTKELEAAKGEVVGLRRTIEALTRQLQAKPAEAQPDRAEAREGAPQITFDDAWDYLQQEGPNSKTLIDLRFAPLLEVAAADSPRALTTEQVITSRQEVIKAIIARLRENAAYCTTDLVKSDPELAGKIRNRRVFPWGARGTIDLSRRLMRWIDRLNGAPD